MKRKKRKLKIKFIMCLIIIGISVFFVSGYFSDRVKLYVKQTATNNASIKIAQAINENVLSQMELENIFEKEKGYINTSSVNKILKEVNENISNNLNDYAYNRIKIPLGLIFSEVLFSDSKIGLTIKTKPISSFVTDVVSKVEEYGINNSMVTVEIVVKIEVMALIPLNEETFIVESHIPIAMLILEGNVPEGIIYTK
ncbi:MAG: sporulation protein YunB [Coprobacillus sp.]|nr:sporulation protein YunB [Coprobacillus sp.]MDY4145335.1 sporulation protein YunB [Bacilli bacterium]OLA11053.1 MAG: hypothetical protein BHW12_00295 [Coprobacillus sp. 28_7]CCY07027.1 sporulation protein YunB [Coprobacillus sp. CAG:698]